MPITNIKFVFPSFVENKDFCYMFILDSTLYPRLVCTSGLMILKDTLKSCWITTNKIKILIDKIIFTALTSLVDCLTSFERILRTPIPLAYSVHLHQAVWLYLLALPYQLVNQLEWFTVPAVTLASFALLGILGIGWEIENPFGTDDNDLVLNLIRSF